MIRIQKKKLSKKTKLAFILGGVFLVLLATYLILGSVLKPKAPEPQEQSLKYEPLAWESQVTNQIYPRFYITENAVTSAYVQIHAPNGQGYAFVKMKDLTGNTDNLLLYLMYEDANGEYNFYYPDICTEDPDFDYTTLYSLEREGALNGAWSIISLASAIGDVYFSERFDLSDLSASEKIARAAAYGFDYTPGSGFSSDYSFDVFFTDKNGREELKSVLIGDEVVTGTGYYMMLADHPEYVYVSNSTLISYVQKPFSYYINPALISPGLASDGSYEPRISPSFKEWKNTYCTDAGSVVIADSTVIVTAKESYPDPGEADGYAIGERRFSFDLQALKDDAAYVRLVHALTGATIGEKPANEIITVMQKQRPFDHDPSDLPTYEYSITAIESILTETDEITATATPVGAYDLLKVTYTYTRRDAAGATAETGVCHGILSLSDPNLPTEAKTALRAASIGTLAEPIAFSMTYTEQNSTVTETKLVVSTLLSILDGSGNTQQQVTAETASVLVRYYYLQDGKKVERSDAKWIRFSDPSAMSMTEDELNALHQTLVGTALGATVDVVAKVDRQYSEILFDFVTYEVERVEAYVTAELIAAFGFANPEDRDPFFGEAIYNNHMNNRYSLYGLNATACDHVLYLLGGLNGDDSSVSSGLSGTETVAVGLTPDVMEQYGLYAYTVEFELPRHLSTAESLTRPGTYNWIWNNTLTFRIFVSEVQPGGFRYAACDLYDVVVKIDGEAFYFLQYSFPEYWARRDLVMVNIDNIESIEVDFAMDDLYGKYLFRLLHEKKDSYTKHTATLQPLDDRYMSEPLRTMLESKPGATYVPLDLFYYTMGGLEMYNEDAAGIGCLKEANILLYFTDYQGILTDEEQAAAAGKEPLLTIKYGIKNGDAVEYYTLEFCRINDRQVMVRMKKQGGYAPVSDFFISTLALKQIVSAFDDVVNARSVDVNFGYGE